MREDGNHRPRRKADPAHRESPSARIEGETELEVEVDPDNDVLHLRPVIVLRREYAWAYTPEHRALLREAHAASREGRVRSLDEDELAALGD